VALFSGTCFLRAFNGLRVRFGAQSRTGRSEDKRPEGLPQKQSTYLQLYLADWLLSYFAPPHPPKRVDGVMGFDGLDVCDGMLVVLRRA
jgi:hypothetical protein